MTPRSCLELAKALREQVSSLPLVFMSYFNPVLNYGVERFCADSARCGVDGLIIPDHPPEGAAELENSALQHGLDPIYLLAPTSTPQRIRLVSQHSRGFIYLVSVKGVTGARERLPEGLDALAGRIRRFTPKPICVGFGISTPEQAAEAARVADGVIVGSRIVEIMGQQDWKPSLAAYVRGLKGAMASQA